MPALRKVNFAPQRLIAFEKRQRADKNQWLHFYTYDERFECVWNNPKKYLEVVNKFEGVITPDFTIFRDFPIVIQAYNTYRNRALGRWWQSNGLNVIPNVRWGDERTFEFAFEGIMEGSTVAVGSLGAFKDPLNRQYFLNGFDEMLKRIIPNTVVIYGPAPMSLQSRCIHAGVKIIHFDCQLKISLEKKGGAKGSNDKT